VPAISKQHSDRWPERASRGGWRGGSLTFYCSATFGADVGFAPASTNGRDEGCMSMAPVLFSQQRERPRGRADTAFRNGLETHQSLPRFKPRSSGRVSWRSRIVCCLAFESSLRKHSDAGLEPVCNVAWGPNLPRQPAAWRLGQKPSRDGLPIGSALPRHPPRQSAAHAVY
jgi:hypothetical protein